MAWLAKLILKFLGGPALDKVLGHVQATRASEVERLRIERGVDVEKIRADVAIGAQARDVVTAGMQHRMFWVAWSLAAIPTSAWYGWGLLDSLANGALPDVAALPPQLKAYADIVWGNIFYAGGAVAGATGAATIIGRAISRR